MPNPFVWFDNLSSKQSETAQFLNTMFEWNQKEFGPMTMQIDGENGPFAGVCDQLKGVSGWVPYMEVEDLAAEGTLAKKAGATIIAEDVTGPAGQATFIQDPGGSVMALWKRKAGMKWI